MTTYKVRLNTIDRVKNFVESVRDVEGSALLSHNGITVDARSILGIFSMNLTGSLELKLETEHIPEALTAYLA